MKVNIQKQMQKHRGYGKRARRRQLRQYKKHSNAIKVFIVRETSRGEEGDISLLEIWCDLHHDCFDDEIFPVGIVDCGYIGFLIGLEYAIEDHFGSYDCYKYDCCQYSGRDENHRMTEEQFDKCSLAGLYNLFYNDIELFAPL